MVPKLIIRIDGSRFSNLEGFFKHFAEMALNGYTWGMNLDAFNDVLRGGFGTPEGGFIIEWQNHAISKQRLGYAETIRQLELRLKRCHPSNIPHVNSEPAAARGGSGSTAFDWLLEIIKTHCAEGSGEEDGVELTLH